MIRDRERIPYRKQFKTEAEVQGDRAHKEHSQGEVFSSWPLPTEDLVNTNPNSAAWPKQQSALCLVLHCRTTRCKTGLMQKAYVNAKGHYPSSWGKEED